MPSWVGIVTIRARIVGVGGGIRGEVELARNSIPQAERWSAGVLQLRAWCLLRRSFGRLVFVSFNIEEAEPQLAFFVQKDAFFSQTPRASPALSCRLLQRGHALSGPDGSEQWGVALESSTYPKHIHCGVF